MAKVKSLALELQQGTDRTVAATWDFTSTQKSNVDYYEVTWHYYTGNGYGYEGDTQQVKQTKTSIKLNTTYSAPSNANHVRCWVRGVSKTYTKNGKDTKYFTCDWAESPAYYFSSNPPDTTDAPTVAIGDTWSDNGAGYKMTAKLTNLNNENTDYIQFRFYKHGTEGNIAEVWTDITGSGTYNANAYTYVSGGGSYKARARGVNNKATGSGSGSKTLLDGTKITLKNASYGEWSAYSDIVSPPPDAPTNLKASANDETSVKLTWTKGSGASGYEVWYAKEKAYLEKSSNEVSSTTVSENVNTTYVTGLDSGEEWFFKIRATNDSGNSGWTDIVSCIIGTEPEAPTTWSSTTTAYIGEVVNLYWVHNCEDGSDQTSAQIQLEISTGSPTTSTQTINISDDTREYALETDSYLDGTEITWQVRTAGILGTSHYGDWSIKRTITVNQIATVELDMPETLESFPYNIVAYVSPESQKPISCHISVFATEAYETTGPTGGTIYVNAGDEIYSKLYNLSSDTTSQLLITLSVGDLTLESGQTYTVTVTVAMNTGQTAENSCDFTVEWDDVDYDPDAELSVDFNSFVAYIQPYCYDDYIPEDEDEDPDDYPPPVLTEGVTLAVYRREVDGSFTLIGDEIENDGVSAVTDPHPGLDYARYRIVVQDTLTGQISYTDLPGFPINQPYVVIQWDEEWSSFDFDNDPAQIANEMDEITWSGSMVKIKGNVDISEANDTDSELIEYIGRESPVSYYGTQIGESGTWNVEIEKDDEETVYQLRRLSRYMGDVYVREPSGIGYWANVSVSMNTNHCATTIPVSFNITRVEGGV